MADGEGAPNEAEMIRVFKSWDKNGDGRIQPDELKAVLAVLDPVNFPPEVTDPLFQVLADAEGYIKYSDFVKWAMSGGQKMVHMLGQLVSPHQFSSTVINAPASAIFDLLRPLNFKWLKTVSAATKADDGTINIAYADHTVQKIQELEFSLLDFEITWEVLESDPPAPTFSATHTIRCHRVTNTGGCLVAWNTDFSSDVMLPVLEDCKWKKVDAFAELAAFVGTPAVAPEHGVGGGAVVSPHQFSSAIINASAGSVFDLLKPLTFKFMKSVAAVSTDEDGTTINIAYADDTVQKVHIVERSELDMKVAWEVLESEPAAQTLSTVHTIRCHRVTDTKDCYVTWTTDYSSDVTNDVIEDARWKKIEAFEQLQEFLGKGSAGAGAAPAAAAS
jgi:hypothetical protein